MGIRPKGNEVYEATCETCGHKRTLTVAMRAQVVMALMHGGWRVSGLETWCEHHALDSIREREK